MPLPDETLLTIEEFKEVGHEYRYREQLMVQEFGLSMLATAATAGVIAANRGTAFALVVQLAGLVFLGFLTLHLRNLNQDRHAALHLKEKLRNKLKFEPVHQNTDGRRRGLITLSALLSMVRFAATLCVAWAIWLAFEIHLYMETFRAP